MKETQLLSLLKGQELTLNALFERSESFTAREKENLQNLLETLIEEGKVGKNQTRYFLLEDKGYFLAKITAKNRNFVVLTVIPSGEEIKISGEERHAPYRGSCLCQRVPKRNVPLPRVFKTELCLERLLFACR